MTDSVYAISRIWRSVLAVRPRVLFVPLFIVTLQAIANLAELDLRYVQPEISDGAYWRVVSGHFVHINSAHCVLNAIGLAIVAELSPAEWTWARFWTLLIVLSVGTSCALFILEPQLMVYSGLSGVLHGAVVLLGIHYSVCGSKIGYAILLLVFVKLLIEQLQQGASNTISSIVGERVAIEAHLWGALAGFVLSPVVVMFSRNLPKVGY